MLTSPPEQPRRITRTGHTFVTASSDFTNHSTHRLLIIQSRDSSKGTIRAEFPDTPKLSTPPGPSWMDQLRPHMTSATTWSVYTDASWRAIHPPQAQAVFGLQGSHHGRGAVFLSADHPDWCSEILAVRFDIPPTLQALVVLFFFSFFGGGNLNLRITVQKSKQHIQYTGKLHTGRS